MSNPVLPPPPALRRTPLRWGQRVQHVLDQVSIYLPIVLMGVLALGAYWLLRTTPIPEAPQPQVATVTHAPDYFMRDFSMRTYDAQGRLKTEVYGSEARHYPGSETLDIDNARIRNVTPEGRTTTANAQRLSTNDDQTVYELNGQALVVREAYTQPSGQAAPRLSIQGEALRVVNSETVKQVESDLPVVLLRDNDRIEADTLRYDDNTSVANLQGKVRVLLPPRP